MHAFLFDLDDTLFDHRYSTRIALAVLREHLPPLAALGDDDLEAQHALVLEEMHRRVLAGEMDVDTARKARFRRLVDMQGGAVESRSIEDASRAYRAAYQAARRAVAGAIDLLQVLRNHGRIAVVSNNVTNEQVEKAAVCGIDRHVDALVISEEVGVAKPDPVIFQVALERLGARPERAVMVGDSWDADVAGAHAAGIPAIWFNPLRRPCPDAALVAAELHAWEPAAEVAAKILACCRQGRT